MGIVKGIWYQGREFAITELIRILGNKILRNSIKIFFCCIRLNPEIQKKIIRNKIHFMALCFCFFQSFDEICFLLLFRAQYITLFRSRKLYLEIYILDESKNI